MKKILPFFILFLGLWLNRAEAATLYFGQPKSDKNNFSVVELYLDTEGQEINAAEISLSFPTSTAVIEDLSDGGSLIPLWIDNPAFSNDDGKISFSGIIPGGFSGKGLLLSIKIKPLNSADIPFTVDKANLLLDSPDGKSIELKNRTLILNNSTSPETLPSSDVYSPESFVPEIIQSPDIFDGRWAVVFSTVDKGSGIDHYEVMEVLPGGGSSWIIASSPYLLTDQSLESDVYIRAVDKAGNFIVIKIPAKNTPSFLRKISFMNVVLILLILIISAVFLIYRKKYASKLEN